MLQVTLTEATAMSSPHTPREALVNSPQAEAGSGRASRRTRGARATRKRTAAMLQSHTNTVAQFRTAGERETIALATNPNRAKHHAARMAPMRENSGERRKTDPRIELRTSFDRIPALGTIHTKNLPTWRS